MYMKYNTVVIVIPLGRFCIIANHWGEGLKGPICLTFIDLC